MTDFGLDEGGICFVGECWKVMRWQKEGVESELGCSFYGNQFPMRDLQLFCDNVTIRLGSGHVDLYGYGSKVVPRETRPSEYLKIESMATDEYLQDMFITKLVHR